MSISKKLRFEVFKRDGFACQYCGGSPPNKLLEVDHIQPKSKNGADDINNLITSCFDCNRGKGKNELHRVPLTLAENTEIIKEKESQYKEYLKTIKNVDKRINAEIKLVEDIFYDYCEYTFTPKFRVSVKKFINSLGITEAKDAMEIAISKGRQPEDTLKYFCGVCWNKIRDVE